MAADVGLIASAHSNSHNDDQPATIILAATTSTVAAHNHLTHSDQMVVVRLLLSETNQIERKCKLCTHFQRSTETVVTRRNMWPG